MIFEQLAFVPTFADLQTLFHKGIPTDGQTIGRTDGPTDGPTDERTDRWTDGQTTRRLELLRAAKNLFLNNWHLFAHLRICKHVAVLI